MAIKLNEKTRQIEFDIEDSDIQDANEIDAILQMPGWKTLKKYYELGRTQIEDMGKKSARSRTKKEIAAEIWAYLDGFDQAVMIPEMFVLRIKEILSQKDKQEADQNGQYDAGQDD